MQMRLDLVIKIYKSKVYFFTFIFNHYLHNLVFGDVVDNVHLEGNMSQRFDLSPSFHFMTKNR